jgi:hypothetical protein
VQIRRVAALACVVLLALSLAKLRPASAGDEWLPISPEELQATSDPAAPGAPAIILYRQVDRDDSSPRTPHEYNYVREKIFTEEGRKNADVDIPFIKDQYTIHNIRARTIHSDGSIVNSTARYTKKRSSKPAGLSTWPRPSRCRTSSPAASSNITT